ncbi:hypothetical protein VNI00_007695 [Paramarasmius palmivorus]|uniref:Uncharacterized protein n=1 Tax=Paramarasmius palmivorus TaxID=297713 RepID=A0AAW0D3H3_9AGAR
MSDLLTPKDGQALTPLAIVLIVLFVMVWIFAVFGIFMSVRQRLRERGSSKSAGQTGGRIIIDEEARGKSFVLKDDFEPKPIPEPLAAYFPVQYRHQMDMEMYGPPPPSARAPQRVKHPKHHDNARRARRLV